MSNLWVMLGRNPINRIVVAQLLATLLLASAATLADLVLAYSIALGGLTGAIPNGFMAWRLSRQVGSPGLAFKSMVMGELGKLGLTALIFASVFVWVKPLNVAIFFAALVLAMMLNVIVPLFDQKRHGQRTQ